MIVIKMFVAVVGSMVAIPIICGLLGEPQSYFERPGMENYAKGIGVSAGVVGFSLAMLTGKLLED